jgi:CRISPR-associated protein Csd2
MYDEARSHTQAGLAAVELIAFNHAHPLGNADARSLFRRVTAELQEGVSVARASRDYSIQVDESQLPTGISVERPKRVDAEALAAQLDSAKNA